MKRIFSLLFMLMILAYPIGLYADNVHGGLDPNPIMTQQQITDIFAQNEVENGNFAILVVVVVDPTPAIYGNDPTDCITNPAAAMKTAIEMQYAEAAAEQTYTFYATWTTADKPLGGQVSSTNTGIILEVTTLNVSAMGASKTSPAE